MVEEEKRKRSEKKEERGETRDPGADARPRGSTRGAGEGRGASSSFGPFLFLETRDARSEKRERDAQKQETSKNQVM